MKIKILFFIDFLTSKDGLIGGTEGQLIKLIQMLDRSKFYPMLICLQKTPDIEIWDSIDCDKYVLNINSLVSRPGISVLLKCVKFLKSNDVHIVQTFFLDSTRFGILAAALSGIKHRISCRNNPELWR